MTEDVLDQLIWSLESTLPTLAFIALGIVAVVLEFRRKNNELEKRSAIIQTALEKSNGTVPEERMKSLNKPQKSLKERLLGKLLWGLSFTIFGAVLFVAKIVRYNAGTTDEIISLGGIALLALGIGYLVYYFVGRRMLSKEIEAEERENLKEN